MDHNMHSMKMYFHGGFGDQFLFQCLTIDNSFKLWSVCGVLFALSFLFEYIKYVRRVQCGCQPRKGLSNGSENGDLQDNSHTSNSRFPQICYVGHLRTMKHRLFQTALHVAQTTLGFLIMLSVMSFNYCIIFAIIVGTGIGYYIFYRPYTEIEAIESCH